MGSPALVVIPASDGARYVQVDSLLTWLRWESRLGKGDLLLSNLLGMVAMRLEDTLGSAGD